MLSGIASTFVRVLVRERTGVSLGPDKDYLLEVRLSPLVRTYGFATIEELANAAALDPGGSLARRIVEAMLTCETFFFRDATPFEQLRTFVLPELERARRASREITIWCAASASGQEPHGVAMLLREHFSHLLGQGWKLRVIASDVSEEMLGRTRAGVYTSLEVNRGLPASYLVRYFVRQGVDWQVREEVRSLVEVRAVNLVDALPLLPPIDVLFLRNVLIYFENDVKRAVLERVRGALRPDGFLFLGSAETTLGLSEGYESLSPARAGCFRPKNAEARDAVPRS